MVIVTIYLQVVIQIIKMVKKKVGNRVFITTKPKVAVYVPTEMDIQYGMKGCPSRTEYDNNLSIVSLKAELYAAITIKDTSVEFLAEATGYKESTIEALIKDPSKALISVLLKVCNYLNLELKDLL